MTLLRTPEPADLRSRNAMLRECFVASRYSLLAAVLMIAMLTAYAADDVPLRALLAWLIGAAALLALRLVWRTRFLALPPAQAAGEWRAWQRRAIAGAAATGVMWASGITMVFRADNLVSQMYCATLAVLTCVGSINVMAPVPRAFHALVWPVAVVLALQSSRKKRWRPSRASSRRPATTCASRCTHWACWRRSGAATPSPCPPSPRPQHLRLQWPGVPSPSASTVRCKTCRHWSRPCSTCRAWTAAARRWPHSLWRWHRCSTARRANLRCKPTSVACSGACGRHRCGCIQTRCSWNACCATCSATLCAARPLAGCCWRRAHGPVVCASACGTPAWA